jgi:hypothetical protein
MLPGLAAAAKEQHAQHGTAMLAGGTAGREPNPAGGPIPQSFGALLENEVDPADSRLAAGKLPAESVNNLGRRAESQCCKRR